MDDYFDKHVVATSQENDNMYVYVQLGFSAKYWAGIVVKPPNFIEKALGITQESKLKKAINKKQKECDK